MSGINSIYGPSRSMAYELKTCEIHAPNDFYGHAKIIKDYAGIDEDYQLKAVIHHGAGVALNIWNKEIENNLPVFLTMGNAFINANKKSINKECYSIGPYIHYAPEFLDAEGFQREKEKLGRVLLFFPAHSTHWIDAHYDIKFVSDYLNIFRNDFDTILVCIFWKDVISGIAEKYIASGFQCVTAGHMYAKDFLPRLKTIINLSDQTMSMGIGSHLGYCIYLNKPHYIFDCKYNLNMNSKEATKPANVNSDHFLKIKNEFKNMNGVITKKQIELINMYFGSDNVRSREELLNLMQKAEDIYASRSEACKAINLTDSNRRNKDSKENALHQTDSVIASFPGSGNTWLRLLISDVILQNNGFETGTVLPVHQDRVVPDIHVHDINDRDPRITLDQRIIKTHNPFDLMPARTVCLFRNPVDSLCSYYYFHKRYDHLAHKTSDGLDVFCLKHVKKWIEHMSSYVQATEKGLGEILFVSYERLHQNTEQALKGALDFLGIEADRDSVRRAVENHTFDKHRAKETLGSKYEEYFFRKGKVGAGQEELKKSTVACIERTALPLYQKALSLQPGVQTRAECPEQGKGNPPVKGLRSLDGKGRGFVQRFLDALDQLGPNLASYRRRAPGVLEISGRQVSFADLHSLYHEGVQIFRDGIYDCDIESPEPLIVDCGAHIGLASIYFALKHARASVLAFEADPAIAALCAQNLKALGISSVELVPKAVWTHNGEVLFACTGDDSGHVDRNDRGDRVQAIRLRDVLAEKPHVDLLKMDIEGAEFAVLEDCSDVLERVQRVVVEVHFLDGGNQKLGRLLSILERGGYNYFLGDLHQANWITPEQCPPFKHFKTDRFIVTVFAWR